MPNAAGSVRKPKFHRYATPAEVLVIGFAAMILIGIFLLMSPAAVREEPLTFAEAAFTATSAVCVTGLSVFDPGATLSEYGQVVLLVLIQCGGLGFMTLTSVITKMAGHRSSLHSRVTLREAINASQLHGLGRTAGGILGITFVCEATGAIAFMVRFIPEYGWGRGVFYSIFHSISSFCNAGFDVFGTGNNLIPYVDDPMVNVVTMCLIVIGGVGFFVILELFKRVRGMRQHRKLSLNTRVVLIWTTVLIAGGACLFLIAEWDNPKTLGAPGTSGGQKVLEAFFQSVSTRTAGFMTVQQGDLRPISKIATVILMFIGASPAGTAGGLKTTTTAVLFAFVWSVLQGRKDVIVLRRRIPTDLIARAIAIFALAVLAIVLVAAAISVLEPQLDLGSVIFETTSAFGTVGLSTGITGALSDPSLYLLIFIMFGGRVGLFTLTMALARRLADHEAYVRFPQERVLIG